ncbi:MAG: DUF4435 domain-containing protein [Magnetospirillum sp.]|nr:DUF4435 domain-containing protein [Magnetospirillum sp.]
MNYSGIPEYSDQAKFHKDLFFDASVIFYFEDNNHEAVYERLMRRLIPSLRKFAIVCLNGKSQLLAKAKDRAPSQGDPTAIFIVDKDFDDILGVMENIKNFYYTKKSCIESYLIDVDAIASIGVEENPTTLTLDLAARRLADCNNFLSKLHEKYEVVTRLFIIVRKHRIQNLQTTKMPLSDLLGDSGYCYPDDDWISKYRESIRNNCLGKTEWLLDETAFDIEFTDAFSPKKCGSILLTQNIRDHMNGKHLLMCVKKYIGDCIGVEFEKMNHLSFYIRLIDKVKLGDFDELVSVIIRDNPSILRA